MWSIYEVKEKGRSAFKANYWRSVLAGLILVLLGGGSATVSFSQTQSGSGSGGSISDLFNNLSDPERAKVAFGILGAVSITMAVSILLKIFLFNPLEVGCLRFFRKNVETRNANLGVINDGFSEYGRVFGTLFLRDLFIALWSLLFIIPGIIKSYSYMMIPYILKDNPELSMTKVITRSRDMMRGHKGRAFLLDLSFIGWDILTALTGGIVGVFWTQPYHESAHAALYLELKK